MKTILIVDDDEVLREVLSDSISLFGGYKTIICESAEMAMPCIDEADAIITDFNMPRMDGAAFAKIVKSQNPNMPVLIMTGRLNAVPKDHQADAVIDNWDICSGIQIVLDWLDKVLKK
jgi:DNA-binding NtrC family response regulator